MDKNRLIYTYRTYINHYKSSVLNFELYLVAKKKGCHSAPQPFYLAGDWATIHHGQLPEIINERTTMKIISSSSYKAKSD